MTVLVQISRQCGEVSTLGFCRTAAIQKNKSFSLCLQSCALSNFSRNIKEQDNVVYLQYKYLESSVDKELSGFKLPIGPALHRTSGFS